MYICACVCALVCIHVDLRIFARVLPLVPAAVCFRVQCASVNAGVLVWVSAAVCLFAQAYVCVSTYDEAWCEDKGVNASKGLQQCRALSKDSVNVTFF